jgi:hypothetical protein
VLPWSLATLTTGADVDHHLTALVDDRIEDIASQVTDPHLRIVEFVSMTGLEDP